MSSLRYPNFSSAQMPVKLSARKITAMHFVEFPVAMGRLISRLRKLQVGRLTLLEPYGMGDAITLEPLISALISSGMEVVLATKRPWLELYESYGQIVPISVSLPWTSYASSRKYRWSAQSIRNLWNERNKLSHESHGTIGIDPRGDLRSIAWLYACGCKEVISFDSYVGSAVKFWLPVAKKIPSRLHLKRWELNLDLLKGLGLGPLEVRRPVFRTSSTVCSGQIAFITTVPYEGREWPKDRWVALGKMLEEKGWVVHVLVGNGQIAQAAKITGGHFAIHEQSSMENWISVLPKYEIIVTLDTGPMHLADALNRPLVALFGPSQIPMWLPSNPKARVITHQSKIPEMPVLQIEHAIPSAKASMELIELDEVYYAVIDLAKEIGDPIAAH